MDILSSEHPSIKLCGRCKKNPRPNPTNSAWCSQCRSEYRKHNYNAERRRDQNLYANYRISLEEYNLMLFQQGGVCALCKRPETIIDSYTKKPKALGVDHNHQTGQVRALLCQSCNNVVRDVEQDRERVKKALKYLKKYDV